MLKLNGFVFQMMSWSTALRRRKAAVWPSKASSTLQTPPTPTTCCKTVETAHGVCFFYFFFWSVSRMCLQSVTCAEHTKWSWLNIHHCLPQTVPRQADRKHESPVCGRWDAPLQLMWDREIDTGQDWVYPFCAHTLCGACTCAEGGRSHWSCVSGEFTVTSLN